jgi:CoA:oxalate CoA-transferase
MKPLDGIRVLDFTRVVAGPLATRILADQGAEVIKVEPPEGDLSRTFPPSLPNDITPYFAQQNAGKYFCSFDLSQPDTPLLLKELAGTCDVIVENFRPGVMKKFGLDAETLRASNPKLVYCSITGFGQTGPWAKRRAYAPIGHLESGLLEYERRKIERPTKQPALVLGDSVTALSAASAINALLVQVARQGIGGYLDVCMVESLVYIQEWVSTELAGGWDSTNAGACQGAPILELPDGQTWGLAGDPVAWFADLSKAMDRPELIDDPRFADPIVRESNRSLITELLTEWAATFSSFELFLTNLESKSPFTAAKLKSIDELAVSEWAQHRDLIADTNTHLKIPARHASGAGIGTTGRVAALGADNVTVLSQMLGYSEDKIRSLQANGALVIASER